MAINLPDTDLDFSKIFALNTPLNPYHWSDSNYQTGWNTVGQTPPTRQQFDALQNFTDKKLNFLRQCVTAFKEGIDGENGLDGRIETLETDVGNVKTQVEKQEVQVVIDPELGQYYVKLGNSFVMQYGQGVTDANGVAKCNFTFDFKATTKADYPTMPEGIGIYIPVPIVWVNGCQSYCAGVGNTNAGDIILRKKNSIYVFISSGQTGLPAPGVDVGVFAFGLAPEAKI